MKSIGMPPTMLWGRKCDPEWARLPTEPLTVEMMDELRVELEKSWRYDEKHNGFPRDIKYRWSEIAQITRLGGKLEDLPSAYLRQFCNKLTCFYWTKNSQLKYGLDESSLIIIAILKEWYRCYSDDPKIDHYFFFANPVLIEPDGPTTVDGILDMHRDFCNKASLQLERLRSSGKVEIGLGGLWPHPQFYNIHPLFRAIIVIHQENLCDEDMEAMNHDGFFHLDEYLESQTVLLVRTGDESGLSGPISFEGILDVVADNIKARASLGAAVKFMADLEKREEAFSRLKIPVLSPDEGGPETRESYAARILHHAMQRGIDNVKETAFAIRRIKARKLGQSFDELVPYQLCRGMK